MVMFARAKRYMDTTEHNLTECLTLIFDQSEDAVFLKTASGRYLLINRAGAAMFGWPIDEIIGRTDRDLFSAEVAADIEEMDRRIMENGASFTYERTRRINGEDRVLFTTKVPYVGPDCDEPLLVGSSRDITSKVALEQQLSHAERHIAMGVLAKGTAHEVNNPLSYVLDSLERLTQEIANAKQALGDMRHQLMMKLGEDKANELLVPLSRRDSMSEIEALVREAKEGADRIRVIMRRLGRFSVPAEEPPEAIDLHELIDHAVAMAAVEIRYRASIVRDYGELPAVVGRVHSLQQMFLNLLIGIVRDIRAGRSNQHVIRIVTAVVDHKAEIRVDGPDIERGHTGNRELSLSAVRHVLIAHGGELEHGPLPDGGFRIVARLPIYTETAAQSSATDASQANSEAGAGRGQDETMRNQADAHTVTRSGGDTDESPPPSANETPSASSKSRKKSKKTKRRVLIVDDEPMMRMMLRRMVGRDSIVEEAGSGLEAVKLLQDSSDFEAILCDFMMPEMTGMDVHEWLVENRPELLPRIGFVTGGVFTERGQEFIRTCTRPILDKPFKRRDVQQLMAQLVGAS